MLEIVVPKKRQLLHVFGVLSGAIFVGMRACLSLGDEYDLGQMLFMHIAQKVENIIFYKIRHSSAGVLFFVCQNVRGM